MALPSYQEKFINCCSLVPRAVLKKSKKKIHLAIKAK